MRGGECEIVHPCGPGLRTLVFFVSQPLRETLFTDPLPSQTLVTWGPRGSQGRFPKVAGGSQSPPSAARRPIIYSYLGLQWPIHPLCPPPEMCLRLVRLVLAASHLEARCVQAVVWRAAPTAGRHAWRRVWNCAPLWARPPHPCFLRFAAPSRVPLYQAFAELDIGHLGSQGLSGRFPYDRRTFPVSSQGSAAPKKVIVNLSSGDSSMSTGPEKTQST
jgi:hypothetical protein